ncbi:MAG: phosphate transport system permease [Beijerinckiaceae bacterium]|nr:MAG: phosphate transport system permease [Beijerinckiaceae bacterium]
MTDAVLTFAQTGPRKVDFFSEEAMARVQKRYRAEARFKAYGLGAVVLAGIFVVILLADIVSKGLPAFFEHRIALTVTLDAAKIDPEGKRDIEVLRAADYQRLIYDGLREEFPGVSDRRDRRKLEGLVSTGSGNDLRTLVLRNPSIIGQKTTLPVLLSDDADLYLKGIGTRVERAVGKGTLDIKQQGKTVELVGSAGAFAAPLADVKARLKRLASATEFELQGLSAAQATANAALEARREDLTARVKDFRQRSGDPASAETLDPATMPSELVEIAGGLVRLTEIAPGRAAGVVLLPLAADATRSDSWHRTTYTTPESNRRITDIEIAWLESLRGRKLTEKGFAWRFFTNGDSREPELAGIRGALIGSALTLAVTLLFCLPIGVGAAVYLEEFAPKNRLTDILEVNINNLAAVPSIVFGLLGLAMFLNFFGLPRSAPLVGGLVLALLVLPTIIIASRAALKAVPPSIKEAALGVGASHQQAIFHHVLPLAMPGIMTGTIIGMAHALGETAPLLMIGMVAFIVDIPQAISDPATVLPVQIYLWSDLPEVAFQAKTAAAIMVLLAFLFVMNGAAILLRRRFEQRW